MRNLVFSISLLLVSAVVALGAYSPQILDDWSTLAYVNIVEHFGWIYLIAAFFFLIFALVLAFSRYGTITLGKDYEKAEYSYFGWFSMLFAAGMGIGLMFWGVGEPLSHYMNPPEQIEQGTGAAAAFAMRYSFFHWGLQPWAIYIAMALPIAYFSFRRNMPPLISSCFYPMLGEKIYGFWGQLIDVLAVLATVFGIATSLGLGALQINGGLAHLSILPETMTTTLMIIAVVTVIYMLTTVIGLDKGLQIASRLNILLAGILLLFLFIAGPTTYILNVFTSTIGEYATRLLEMSLQANPFEGHEWTKSWTVFYWAWWIAWAPFVGLFIARISRGRTIKEFVLGVLMVPALLTFFWFSVFGGTGLYLQMQEGVNIAQVALDNVSTVLFVMFDHLPLGVVLSGISLVLLVTFFVTSANSATFVLGMMTSKGNMSPPLYKKSIWGLAQAGIAVVLLFSGGLAALQQMAIAAALPFTIVMLLMCYNFVLALKQECPSGICR